MGRSAHERVLGDSDISCWVLKGRNEALMRSTASMPYGFRKSMANASASITRCGSARTVSSAPSWQPMFTQSTSEMKHGRLHFRKTSSSDIQNI